MIDNVFTNPEIFSRAFLKILDKNQQLIAFEFNKCQRDFLANRTGYDLILKSRQMGFSTLIQSLIFHQAITKSTSAMILAHDSATTEKMRLIQDRFYENFPTNIKEFHRPIRKYANSTLTTYPETNSTITIATAGSPNVGRGGTYTVFHGSEVAFWNNPDEIIAVAAQGMREPNIILESTPNGAQGWFYERCMDAIAGRGLWKLHFYPWFEFDEYKVDGFKERKLGELHDLFYQEYPEDVVSCFLTSNRGFFSDIKQNMYTSPENIEYNASHKYTAGLDFGQSNDFTCMIVIDRTDRKMVDRLHINKMSCNLQRQEIRRMVNKWHLQGCRAERNSIGSVNIEELEKDGVAIEAFDTTNASKANIFQRLHEELETGLELQNWVHIKK